MSSASVQCVTLTSSYWQMSCTSCVSFSVCPVVLPSMTMPQLNFSSGGHLPIAIMVYVQSGIKVVNGSPHNVSFVHLSNSHWHQQGASFLYQLHLQLQLLLQLDNFADHSTDRLQWLNYFLLDNLRINQSLAAPT